MASLAQDGVEAQKARAGMYRRGAAVVAAVVGELRVLDVGRGERVEEYC